MWFTDRNWAIILPCLPTIRFNDQNWELLTFQTSAWRVPGFYWAPRWSDWGRVSCRTEAGAGDRGSGVDRLDRQAGRAIRCHVGKACPGEGQTFVGECWGGWGMEKGRMRRSPAPLEARKSSLSWVAEVESAFPQACRATSLAGKNLGNC